MHKHVGGFVCATLVVLFLLPTGSSATIDELTLPRLTRESLVYLGGFRLPAGIQGDSFDYGGGPVAFNPVRNSLFVGSGSHAIAEITIPNVVNSSNPEAMPFASYLQPFADISEGHWRELDSNVLMNGLIVHGDRLVGNAAIYYDANNVQTMSHFSHSMQLNQPSFSGWSQVGDSGRSGFVAGPMAKVPAAWQARLGGAAVTGQCCMPITWRTSAGPAAYSFNPTAVGAAVVPAQPLLYYPMGHETLGPWSGANPVFGATTQITGMAIIEGTRTALYVGTNGVGTHCYGNGTSNPALHGQRSDDGGEFCYDPTTTDKGSHAYPYRYQFWAYDLKDLADVKAGLKQPWDLVPYAVWPFDFPTSEPKVKIGGMGYDPQRQILYVSQLKADTAGYAYRPIIHAFRINGAVGGTNAPLVSSVALGAEKEAPQAPQTSISFLAVPIGGVTPYQYQWSVTDGVQTTVVANWSSNNRYTWTPTSANASYRVIVAVRSSGNTGNPEATASMAFPIGMAGPSPPSTHVTGVTMTPNKPSPQPAGTTVTFTAAASGGVAPHEFKWFVYDGSAWNLSANWSTSKTFTWTPTSPHSQYRVSVWARSSGNTRDYFEASIEDGYPIATSGGTAPPPPNPTTPTALVSGVTMRPSLAVPQRPGTAITWTAQSAGGVAPHQYKWFVYNGSAWTIAMDWSAANTFTWTPAVANPGYRVSVWVRSAGSAKDYFEASAEDGFRIDGTAVAAPAPLPPAPSGGSSTPVASVILGANLVAPQRVGTAVTWTALPSGGASPQQYKWFVFDGNTWTMAADWTTSRTFTWTPGVANSRYRVSVWVRSAGSTKDYFEASAENGFPIDGGGSVTASSGRVTAVGLTANKVAPQGVGTAITWTAVPNGGVAPQQYKWFVFNGSSWAIAANWSAANTFTWTPATPNSGYRVSVWVRSAGSSNDYFEASAEDGFRIGSTAVAAPPPASSGGTSTPVASVIIGTNLIAPQRVGTAVTWTALASGGASPLQYKWFVFDGNAWTTAVDWTTSKTFTWTPTVGNSRYRVSVWVRSAGSTKDYFEASAENGFPIDGSGATSGPLTAVALTTNRAAPQKVGTPITWTAVPNGGAAPHQYKWFVFNGSTWTLAVNWSAANTFTWTPATANDRYRVAVWVRSAGNTNDYFETSAENGFPVVP